ncbi:MAG: hypothetical protein ACM3ZU_00385 [Bacteroidota bacterium]
MTRFIAFIGPPGSGKTTQIGLLEKVLSPAGLVVASVPRLLRRQDSLIRLLSAEERAELDALMAAAQAARLRGELAPIALDRILFRGLSRITGDALVALDGCPRGAQQARLFLGLASLRQNTTVVQLRMGDTCDEIGVSVHRQFRRESLRRGEEAALARYPVFKRKVEIYLEDTLAAVAILEEAGVPVRRVDAMLTPDEVHRRVLSIVKASENS